MSSVSSTLSRTPTVAFHFTPTLIPLSTLITSDLAPPENKAATLLSVIAIVSCIGLLGFGIGYLRLRQMQRLDRENDLAVVDVEQQCIQDINLSSSPVRDSVPLQVSRSNSLAVTRPVENHFAGDAPPPYEHPSPATHSSKAQ